MKLSFIIPILNEQDSLSELYDEILQNCVSYDYEIIFIDDGSSDNSFGVMQQMAAKDEKVKVIKFRRNFGKAAALQLGFTIASGEIVFTLDGDLQDNPIEIPHFIEKLNEGYDLVSGWKRKRHDPLYKTLPSKLFNFVTAKTFRLKLKDYNCGFKAYRHPLEKELTLYGEMHRYIPVLAHSLGYKVGEIAVTHRPRKYGKSKYGKERYLRGFFDLLTVKMITQYSKSPLYLFGRIGVASTLIGIIIGIYLAVLKLFYGQPLSNRPLLLLGILLIIGGLQFISLGLISELIVNRFRQGKKTLISIAQCLNIETSLPLPEESQSLID
ncbi:MAG TPA: glycosyltransferase family 2 protein [Candidatus Cloacimonas sp.]|nr:glycosyltransferase family 2 protein [Candidatus Cloacimonas sp.]HPS61158.1 glycosyltransferase family 2 protein [Candidatus Cloacimonas sp.]